MAVVRGRRVSGVSAEEARRQLTHELLDLPELFSGDLESPFVVVPAEAPSKPETVGVVFVHGVGSQRKGDALREFGTPLVDWVEEWHRSRGLESKVTWAELTQPGEPAHAALVLPACPNHDPAEPDYPGQRWMLAEAWWAPRVTAPEYITMLGWAWKRVPWLIDGLWDGAQASWREPVFFNDDGRVRPPAQRRLRAVLAFVERVGQLLNTITISILYFLVQLAIMVSLIILAVIARLPLFGLEKFVLVQVLRPLIVDNVGDFYVFVYDRIQAVHIRQSIYETVNFLVKARQCSRVVIAAHSGGTVVAVDALGTPDLAEGVGPNDRKLPDPMQKVDTLITFGAALNRAWGEVGTGDRSKSARVIPERLHPPAKWLNFWTNYDWAHPGRPLDSGQASLKENGGRGSIPVINGLSALNDHGGYFHNYEQFISRLAQEVEGPRTRFAEGQTARDRSRRGRVGVLTAWRAVAVISAIAIVGYRYLLVGRSAVADGQAIWNAIGQVPALGGVLGGIASIAAFVFAIPPALPLGVVGMAALVSTAWAAVGAGRLTLTSVVLLWALVFVLLDATMTSALRSAVLAFSATAVVVLACGLAYWSYLAVVFSAWDRNMSFLSARPARGLRPVVNKLYSPEFIPDARGDLALRTVFYASIAVGLAMLLAMAPSFADIPSAFTALSRR